MAAVVVVVMENSVPVFKIKSFTLKEEGVCPKSCEDMKGECHCCL